MKHSLLSLLFVKMKCNYKNKGESSDQGHIPLSKMAVITMEQMLECLKKAGLAKSADLLQSECKTKKVILKSNVILVLISVRVSLCVG